MQNAYSVAAHWKGDFEERALQTWAESLRTRLEHSPVSLGLVFTTPALFEQAASVLEILRVHAQIPLLVGCSSQGLIAGDLEEEETSGLVLSLHHLPGANLNAVYFSQEELADGLGAGEQRTEPNVPKPQSTHGWLVFADPFHLDCEAWLAQWNQAYPTLPILGGLASGDFNAQRTQVYLNGDVYEEGGVAISVGGRMALRSVISQGCTPIGETWTITKAERNFIHEIANRPAYEILAHTFHQLAPHEKQHARGNLFIGIASNEYRDDFRRGDFLIRNLIAADPNTGVLAVGAYPRAGQTIQFQRRDAASSTEDLRVLLERAHQELQGQTIYGGCLCCCNGRGQRLFGQPHHDTRMVQQTLGPFGLSGFFCNGEIGPVGDKNFLHGYTASLALFVDHSPAQTEFQGSLARPASDP